MPSENTHKDTARIYEQEIAPLITKILEVCDEHGIALTAAFGVQDKDGIAAIISTMRCNDTHGPKAALPTLRMMYRLLDGNSKLAILASLIQASKTSGPDGDGPACNCEECGIRDYCPANDSGTAEQAQPTKTSKEPN